METMTWAQLLHRLAAVPKAHGLDRGRSAPRRSGTGVAAAMQAWALQRARR